MKTKLNLILASILGVILLSGCGGVSAPTGLALNDRTLSWNEVRNATSYRVLINEEDAIDTDDNILVVPNQYFGPTTFKVAAYAGTNLSDYSAVLSSDVYLTLEAPANVRQDGEYVRWDEVEYAAGYVVKVGTIENAATDTQYEIVSSTPVQVSILATGSEDGFVISSDFSPSIWFKVVLQAPSSITYENGILSWNAVSNAVSYSVIIDDGDPQSTTNNQLNIGFDHVGSIEFKVKAISGSDQYFDSAYGEATIQIAPLTLSAPQNLDIASGILSFDLVEHATAYGIYHNDVFVEEISNNSYAIPGAILAQNDTYLQVQARSQVHNDSELSIKVYIGALEITTEAQLRAMTATGNYSLNNDIILTTDWLPKDFRGVFNGKGHAISALNIGGTTNSDQGLFGVLDGATISNLNLSGSIALSTTEESLGIGALAGKAINSAISNVHVTADVDVTSSNGIVGVGGLIGHVDGGQITSSTYMGDMAVENAIAGGLIGRVSSSLSSLTTIEESGSAGTLVVIGGEQSFAGGLVGLLENNNAAINRSRSLMDVTGTSYVGGFVGYMAYGSIIDCYSRGTLNASSATLVHAGGFVGRLEGYNIAISYSIAMMTIGITQVGDKVFVGSFAGVTPGGSYANIYNNCYYDSTLSSFDRIGNSSSGRGDGITGQSSSGLLNIQNFNVSYWTFAGIYPMLAWEV